jgi:hypothetical protein
MLLSVSIGHGSNSAVSVDGSKWELEKSDAVTVQTVSTEESQFHGVAADTLFTELTGGASTPQISIRANDALHEWTSQNQRRFIKLVKANALERLSTEEKRELGALQVARRTYCHPRTSEEIIWEHRRREATSGLVKALSRYVTVFNIKNQAGTGTAKKAKA